MALPCTQGIHSGRPFSSSSLNAQAVTPTFTVSRETMPRTHSVSRLMFFQYSSRSRLSVLAVRVGRDQLLPGRVEAEVLEGTDRVEPRPVEVLGTLVMAEVVRDIGDVVPVPHDPLLRGAVQRHADGVVGRGPDDETARRRCRQHRLAAARMPVDQHRDVLAGTNRLNLRRQPGAWPGPAPRACRTHWVSSA